ncbi:cell division protein FtsL [Pseudoalteromonas denitrificans]|uniref:Cell division protein FtsL n=1 Tax=Pseudoalteromonas denitrificans DSM 6059 TaxID=1123010 RepID=A0A1I1QLX2_9GAMM|nr:cell division protein FtsL [Pseudoalteromonas denitrificans]SFD23059.1 cell division protein FtsL [Pseudoalteromonas denitrificans DSM 6059]
MDIKSSVIKKNTRQPNLFAEIFKGFFKEKIVFLLLFLIFITALAVVQVTHASRQELILQDQLLQQRDDLDLQWRYLLVEQEFYAQHVRIEEIAKTKLQMKRPQSKDEQVVILP